jgi:hypothetical protein
MLHVEANSCDRPQFVGLRIYCRMDWQRKSNEIEKNRSRYDSESERTYVTGISPQSTILRPELKGLTSRGTLYPPYKVKRRDPARMPAVVKALG